MQLYHDGDVVGLRLLGIHDQRLDHVLGLRARQRRALQTLKRRDERGRERPARAGNRHLEWR